MYSSGRDFVDGCVYQAQSQRHLSLSMIVHGRRYSVAADRLASCPDVAVLQRWIWWRVKLEVEPDMPNRAIPHCGSNYGGLLPGRYTVISWGISFVTRSHCRLTLLLSHCGSLSYPLFGIPRIRAPRGTTCPLEPSSSKRDQRELGGSVIRQNRHLAPSEQPLFGLR